MKWYQNPKILCFAGGVAAALVGAKVAKSPKTRELCVAGMAKPSGAANRRRRCGDS